MVKQNRIKLNICGLGVEIVISIDDMHIQIVEKYMFFKYLFLLILIIRIFKHIRLLNT